MPRQIWNEGRVVGFSAYEMYVKHAKSLDPSRNVASEKEWLSSMMAMGSSMLLRVGTDSVSGIHYIDVDFPQDSRLCAANVILASAFIGSGYIGENKSDSYTGWATKVTDYGPLISNTEGVSPSETGSTVPTVADMSTVLSSYRPQLESYLKILDGIIIQPGTWTTNPTSNQPPYKDFKPDIADVPKLRICVSDKITTPFYILLTGFTNRAVVNGVTGFDTATNTNSPSDGDFLGPWAFPWAAKVIFSIPPSLIDAVSSGSNSVYTRELPTGDPAKEVDASPIIDMGTSNPKDFYDVNYSDSMVDVNITSLEISGSSASIFALYQYGDANTPALFGMSVTATDTNSNDNKLCPIDVVAPGTVKVYQGTSSELSTEDTAISNMVNLETNVPYNIAFGRDTNYVVYELNDTGNITPVSDDDYVPLLGALRSNEAFTPVLVYQHNSGETDDSISIIGYRRLHGYLGEEYKNKYALSDVQLEAILSTGTDNGSGHSFVVTDAMQAAIQDSELNPNHKYYYVLHSTSGYTGAANYWEIIPIREDGYIDIIVGYYYNDGGGGIPSEWNNPDKEVIIPTDNTDKDTLDDQYVLFGSWWSNSVPIGLNADLTNQFTSEHPKLSDLAVTLSIGDDLMLFDRSDRYMPSSGSYDSYDTLYKNTTLPEAAYYTDGISNTYLHSSLSGKSVYEIVRASRLYDIRENGTEELTPITYTSTVNGTNRTVHGRKYNFYTMSNEDVNSCITPYTADIASENGYKKVSVDVASGTINRDSEIASGPMFNWKLTKSKNLMNFATYMTESTIDRTVLVDIPSEFQLKDSPQATRGRSGNHETLGLSVAKSDGSLCNLFGTDGVISPDRLSNGMLHWIDLANALYNGQAIDVLGEILRELRAYVSKSGNGFIELGSGADGDGEPIRLYLSRTEPTASEEIPDGSIGIGW